MGEPQISITLDGELLFSIPITIVNNGYYDLSHFNLTTRILDENDLLIANGSTFVPRIRKGVETIITHNVTMDINDLLEKNQNYLFNDAELKICETVAIRLADVIPVQASTNITLPWGAPLYNFTIKEIVYTPINLTHVGFIIPFSFENHAFFDLIGNIQIHLYNDKDKLLGKGETSIEAPQNSFYEGHMELQLTEISEKGYFEIYFQTQFFNYGPLVIPYG
jgi:hypothetical protein